MKRILSLILAVFCVLNTMTGFGQALEMTGDASGPDIVAATSGTKYDADFNLQSQGVLKGLLNDSQTKKYKLGVSESTQQYLYDKASMPLYEDFPLQMGDGTYTVKFYENTVESKYKVIYNKSSYVKVTSQTTLYMISNQQIRWSSADDAVQYAQKLVRDQAALKGVETLLPRQKLDVIYSYIINNYTYDYDKIKTLKSDYVPDIDLILAAKEGICFDYSVLFGAMLRSQGIPAKLVKGYATTTDVYHAWNEVYLPDEQRWIVVDTTYDAYMAQHKQKYSMEKSTADYSKKYEY